MKSKILGAAVAFIGAATMFYGFLQPWKSCPTIDDSSAACPGDIVSNSVLLGGLAAFIAGIVIMAFGWSASTRQSRVPQSSPENH